VDSVDALPRLLDDIVAAAVDEIDVVTGATHQTVVSAGPVQQIIAGPAGYCVGKRVADGGSSRTAGIEISCITRVS
jgi:hypothetical protein